MSARVRSQARLRRSGHPRAARAGGPERRSRAWLRTTERRSRAWLCTLAFLVAGCGARGDGTAAAAFAGEVDASCGSCGLGLDGPECELAVRIEGRALLVSGTGIDDHGDAHAPDGFCNAIRRARVRGRIEGDRFVADSFELLPPR